MNEAARASCWLHLADVDVAPLVRFIAAGVPWPQVKGGQPNRVHAPGCAWALINGILKVFKGPVSFDPYYACLSRLVPGSTYEYHRDPQLPNWITRVHLPIVTNPEAWLMFQETDGERVHFEAGRAYSFNTLRFHRYGNDGPTDRVHLLFDVLEVRK